MDKNLGSAPRVTIEMLEDNIVDTEIVTHTAKSGQVLRWAVLTTKNGYAVTGRHSASVSPENDNAAIGSEIAIRSAKDKLWELMGYQLKQSLYTQVGESDGEGSK